MAGGSIPQEREALVTEVPPDHAGQEAEKHRDENEADETKEDVDNVGEDQTENVFDDTVNVAGRDLFGGVAEEFEGAEAVEETQEDGDHDSLEEAIEVPVLRVMDEPIEAVQAITGEQVHKCTTEQIVDSQVSHVKDESMRSRSCRTRCRTTQSSKSIPCQFHRFGKKTADITQLNPQEPIQERIVEETINVPIPRLMEETMESVKHIPQERIRHHGFGKKLGR